MSEQQPTELSILANLQGALGIKCPQCGEMNSADMIECENCGSPLPEEEEDEPELSFVQAEGTSIGGSDKVVEKIPLEYSKNLILLQDAVDAVEAGQMSLQDYQQAVSKVLNIARTQHESFSSDIMKEKLQQIPEEFRKLVEETGVLWHEYFKACSKMMEFDGGANLNPAIEGLQMVEDVLWKMDKLQDRLVMKNREIALEPDDAPPDDKGGGQQSEQAQPPDEKTYA